MAATHEKVTASPEGRLDSISEHEHARDFALLSISLYGNYSEHDGMEAAIASLNECR